MCPSAHLSSEGTTDAHESGAGGTPGAGCRFPRAAELWLTLLIRDSLVTAAQREGPSLTPSWSSLMDAVAWEMVRDADAWGWGRAILGQEDTQEERPKSEL